MKEPDPTFVAVAVLLGATPDEALASLDTTAQQTAEHAGDAGDAEKKARDATARLLLRSLRSTDRMTRARAMAAGVEPVLRDLASLFDVTTGQVPAETQAHAVGKGGAR